MLAIFGEKQGHRQILREKDKGERERRKRGGERGEKERETRERGRER